MSVYPLLKVGGNSYITSIEDSNLYLYHFCSDCININFTVLCVLVIYGAPVCMYVYIQYKYQCLMCSVLLCVVSRTR